MTGKKNAVALQRLSQKIICQAVRDIASHKVRLQRTAMDFCRSSGFKTHLDRAGYPPELSSAIDEMVLRSKAQRVGLAKEIIEVLDEHWNINEKNPRGNRGSWK